MTLTVNGSPIRYDIAPESVRGGLERYFEHHICPGDFLTAVLANDLMDAVGRADSGNLDNLFNICSWLYNYAPAPNSTYWGSREAIRCWLTKKE